MLTVDKLIAQGRGLAKALLARAATVELDWNVRQRNRFDARDSLGRTLGVFLPQGTVVRGGDVLVAEDGALIVVRAAPQPVLVVRACGEHGAPLDLMRAAYRLGDRHVALELASDHLKLAPDPALADLLRRQHLIVTDAVEPFEPEAGDHDGAGGHGHSHRHDHAHAGDHGHDHGGGHSHSHADPGHRH